jgi:pimeloyl-ACP methyl ester carboxylesterase
VLVHGWCLNRGMWMYLEESLVRDGHEVINVDLAGFGDSSALAGPYSLDRHAADVADLLDETGAVRPVLVGFAFGAAVLMSLPGFDSVAGLVLIGAPSAAASPYRRMANSMRRDWPDFARRSAAAICADPKSDATAGWLAGMFGATRLAVAIETVEVLAEFEPAAVAHRVNAPVLLLHGSADLIVPVQVSRDCAAAMPDAVITVIDGAGHLVVLDRPAALADAVRDFARARAQDTGTRPVAV